MEMLKYNTAGQILYTVLLTANSRSAQANPTLATGDVTVSKDGGAFANITTLPDVQPASGVQVRIQLSATELQCKVLTIRFRDQTGTMEWDEQYVQVATYGNASAFMAFDFSKTVETALTDQGYTTTRASYLDTLNGLVAAIWASGTRTLTSFGTLVADTATAIWGAAVRSLTTLSGLTADSNIVSIDGQTTIGNNATLNLKQLNIQNSSGTAVVVASPAGAGITVNSLDNAVTLQSTDQAALSAISTNGVAVYFASATIAFYVNGGAYGFLANSTSGKGIEASGATHGIRAVATGLNGDGMALASGGGTGLDFLLETPSASTIPADLVSIDGQATAGNNATLNLKKLSIINSGDNAVIVSSDYNAGPTVRIDNTNLTNALAVGIYAVNGVGLVISASVGAQIFGLDSDALQLQGGGSAGHGLYAKGTPSASGSGVWVEGGANGTGMTLKGGGTNPGLHILVTSSGTTAMLVEGALAGDGLTIKSGPNAGNAVSLESAAGNGVDINAINGVSIVASVVGISLSMTNDGIPLSMAASGTGQGMVITSPNNNAIEVQASSTGHAVSLTTAAGDCMRLTSNFGGNGISIIATVGININASGIGSLISGGNIGIRAVGGTGSGVSLLKGTDPSAHDLTFETPDCTIPVVTDVINEVIADMVKIDGQSIPAGSLSISAASMETGTVDDTAFAPTVTEFEVSDITDADEDFYIGRTVIVTVGTLAKQARLITGYELVGGRGHFTVKPLTNPLSDGDEIIIV